ncbi:YwqG family protein [Paenibacillus sp.]|uniref:YwqG family protein n=1 Tax=Paenibacillus sp. TaxID=58172 RepID=UPI002811D8B7|nr:YwqG family protein [Paenibacillus sp.]
MNREVIVTLLKEAGLESYTSALDSWIYPIAQMVLEPESDHLIPIGSSKVGGDPDLPQQLEWPTWKNYSMTFIAQINLADCPAELSLPKVGLLSFFYAVQAMDEEEDFYRNPETCRVIYTCADQLNPLLRREAPQNLNEEALMRSNRVSFVPSLSVPPSESAYLESLGLGWRGDREDFDKYWGIFLPALSKNWNQEGFIHRIMGHPDQIQGDMQVGCEMIYGGYTLDNLEKNTELYKQVVASARKWRLLLQIDSEEDKTGIMWGDVGRLYFWIHEDDLKVLRFHRVFCEMQCT